MSNIQGANILQAFQLWFCISVYFYLHKFCLIFEFLFVCRQNTIWIYCVMNSILCGDVFVWHNAFVEKKNQNHKNILFIVQSELMQKQSERLSTNKNFLAENKQRNTLTVSVCDTQLERFEIYKHTMPRIQRCFTKLQQRIFSWNSECHDIVPLDFAIERARKTNFDLSCFVLYTVFLSNFSTSKLSMWCALLCFNSNETD